jgi:hypothetical protein
MPVAIETSRGLLVAALRATGRAIYASWLRTITVLARAAQDTIWRRTKAGPLALSTSRSGRGPSDPAAEVRVFGSGVDDIDHADQTPKSRAHLRGRVARRAGIPARWEPSGGVCRSRG